MRQVLWERGLHVDGMSTGANVAPHMRLDTVLSNQPDFRGEKLALTHLVVSRGHIALLSPKCHPEVAGVGIEYSWGMSKMKFRREINDEVPKNLQHNIVKPICPRKILTTERVRRFARRARDYCRSYLVLDMVGSIDSQEIIEKMRKTQKAHRNIIDMEPDFLATQYQSSGRGRSILGYVSVESTTGRCHHVSPSKGKDHVDFFSRLARGDALLLYKYCLPSSST